MNYRGQGGIEDTRGRIADHIPGHQRPLRVAQHAGQFPGRERLVHLGRRDRDGEFARQVAYRAVLYRHAQRGSPETPGDCGQDQTDGLRRAGAGGDDVDGRRPGPAQVKVFGWYDNEWGYANRLVDLTTAFARHA